MACVTSRRFQHEGVAPVGCDDATVDEVAHDAVPPRPPVAVSKAMVEAKTGVDGRMAAGGTPGDALDLAFTSQRAHHDLEMSREPARMRLTPSRSSFASWLIVASPSAA